MSFINRIIAVCLVLCAALSLVGWANAPATGGAKPEENKAAEELTEKLSVEYGDSATTITCDKNIVGLYIEWKNLPGSYTLMVKDKKGKVKKEATCGENRFWHEYIEVNEKTAVLNVKNGKGNISKIRAFGKGTLPSDVQVWEKPCETADLMLLTTHSDDEHLFFAGILPYYAGELGLDVQVVYMVDHAQNSESRPHELLNGLWSVGVRNYPVIGNVPDLYSTSLGAGYSAFENAGYGREYFAEYVTENLRRFKPLVVVGHDINGEYGHGAHMVYTDALIKAAKVSGDASYHKESAEKYGTWEVPKIYLHLYQENEIVMDWDSKVLSKFGGRTAFQVSIQEGYSKHTSQHYTWFSKWCGYYDGWGVKSAADIEKLGPSQLNLIKEGGLSPRRFGLYQTLVGADKEKNDFFENIDASAIRANGVASKPTTAPTEAPTEVPAEDPTAEATLDVDASIEPSAESTDNSGALQGGTTGMPTSEATYFAEGEETQKPDKKEFDKDGVFMVVMCGVAIVAVIVYSIIMLRRDEVEADDTLTY